MSDSLISFSKDIASTIGLSEAVLLQVLKAQSPAVCNLNDLKSHLSFWTETEILLSLIHI